MRYAIFGTGRAAQSIAAWLRALGHEVDLIAHADARGRSPDCRKALAGADVIAAAIPDSALQEWRADFDAEIGERPAVHFSGAHLIEGAYSYHPLCAFPKSPLPMAAMARVAFARQEDAPPLAAMFPGAANREFPVRDGDRALYHALAVLSGNFATFIWNQTAQTMAARLSLDPGEILTPYLEGVVARFADAPFDSLTGPVARRDPSSVAANLAALDDEPELKELYEAFLASAWPDLEPRK